MSKLDKAKAIAEETKVMTMDAIKALPGFLGKIASVQVAEYGFYMYNNTTSGKKTLIIKAQPLKTILHLCADLGSDSKYYQLDPEYSVIMIGEKIGVENYDPPENVHGIIANPVCTEFQTINGYGRVNDTDV